MGLWTPRRGELEEGGKQGLLVCCKLAESTGRRHSPFPGKLNLLPGAWCAAKAGSWGTGTVPMLLQAWEPPWLLMGMVPCQGRGGVTVTPMLFPSQPHSFNCWGLGGTCAPTASSA